MTTNKYYFDEDVDLKSRALFRKYKRDLPRARKLAKVLGHGYMRGNGIEKDSIHEAFCFYKTSLEKIDNENGRHAVDYSVSSLINTITVHVILKAFDMGG